MKSELARIRRNVRRYVGVRIFEATHGRVDEFVRPVVRCHRVVERDVEGGRSRHIRITILFEVDSDSETIPIVDVEPTTYRKEKMKRKCVYCAHLISGRSDKKFCGDSCRNSYNNDKNRDRNLLVKKFHQRLVSNRMAARSHSKSVYRQRTTHHTRNFQQRTHQSGIRQY